MRTLDQVQLETRRRVDAARPYIGDFERLRDALPGDDTLARLRERAIGRAAALGLPSPVVEDWKYTDLKLLRDAAFPPAPAEPKLTLDDIAPHRRPGFALVVFENGRFRADLSDLPKAKGVEAASLATLLGAPPAWLETALAEDHEGADAIALLNSAMMTDGLAIRLQKGASLAAPLHLLHAASRPGASYLRHVMDLGEGAALDVLESFADFGAGRALVNVTRDIALDRNASLRIATHQKDGGEAAHLSRAFVTLQSAARFEGFAYAEGARLSRAETAVRLEGEGARADLLGVTLGSASQSADHVTLLDHAVAGATSRQLFKAVLDDASRSAFQGRVLVRPGADATDARQAHHSLLLSRGAEADSKPELEIHADDVACGHGATVGELDADQLFYMKARGIPESEARAMLIDAFIEEPVSAISSEALRAAIAAALSGRGEKTP